MLAVLLPRPDPDLSVLARRVAETSIAAVAPKADPKDVGVAVGLVDRASGTVRWGGFNEARTHYPASTIKLFWLVYAQRRIVDRKLKPTPELDAAMHEMIVVSSNVATGTVVDAVTGAEGGTELAPKALARWLDRRQATNRYFKRLGYDGVNVLHKTYDEGPTGRERQAYGPSFENRNRMSPLAGMRLLSEVMLDRIVTPEACVYMRELLHRTRPDDDQVKDFTGEQLAPGYALWSKAGWTSTAKCDLAWLRAPDGREVVMSIFTEGSAREEGLLPRIARELLIGLKLPVK